ncbi:MAG: ABC transporter ATP-binding protein [Fuerstiella sp.]|nr:ABC transporter ATP-binding protein [Fuerstiella sp.]
MMLQLQQVCKTYGGNPSPVHAVSDVSIDLDKGDFVAVQGPSGCGKSTVLLTAGGLLQPDSGTVRVAGTNPYDLSPDARASFRAGTIGFVFQQFHLIPYLDVLENVLSPGIVVSNSPDEVRKKAEQLLEHFGLAHRRGHLPGELSSGERQRTALARALLNSPQLLLADEPTGNLDRESAEAVLGHMKEFAEAGGTVLLVTHDDRAVQFAGRAIHLRDGRISSPVQAGQSEASC